MAMHIDIHKHTTISLLVKLCELALLISSILVVFDQKFGCTYRWTELGSCTFYLLKIDHNICSNYAINGQNGNYHAQLHQDSTLESLEL